LVGILTPTSLCSYLPLAESKATQISALIDRQDISFELDVFPKPSGAMSLSANVSVPNAVERSSSPKEVSILVSRGAGYQGEETGSKRQISFASTAATIYTYFNRVYTVRALGRAPPGLPSPGGCTRALYQA